MILTLTLIYAADEKWHSYFKKSTGDVLKEHDHLFMKSQNCIWDKCLFLYPRDRTWEIYIIFELIIEFKFLFSEENFTEMGEGGGVLGSKGCVNPSPWHRRTNPLATQHLRDRFSKYYFLGRWKGAADIATDLRSRLVESGSTEEQIPWLSSVSLSVKWSFSHSSLA